jgi:hypothetical protein
MFVTVVLPLILDGQKLTKGVGFPKTIASDSKQFLELQLSGVPDGVIAKAYFKQSWDVENNIYDETFYNGSLIIPEYLTTLPEETNKYVDYVVSVSVTLFGRDEERGNTNPIEIVFEKSNYSHSTTNSPELPPSQYEQLLGEALHSFVVDDNLSIDSINPVQNKVVSDRLLNLTDRVLGLETHKISVDNQLDSNSTNPVQNKVVNQAIGEVRTTVTGMGVAVNNNTEQVNRLSGLVVTDGQRVDALQTQMQTVGNTAGNAMSTASAAHQRIEPLETAINLMGEFTEPEPFVPGKNLYNKDTAQFGLLNYSNGTVNESTTNKVSDFIEVEPGKTYALSNEPTSGENKGKQILSTAYNWCIYDENYARPAGVGGRNEGNPFTIPEGIKYFRFSMYHTGKNIMFEECTQAEIDAGTVPSAYEPYKDPADYDPGEASFTISMDALPEEIEQTPERLSGIEDDVEQLKENIGGGVVQAPPIGLHTMPKSEGVLNAIKRARHLTDIKWTPPVDVPRICFPTSDTYKDSHGALYADVFKAGVEYTGMPYSGRHKPGNDTSIDAFATSIASANSITAKETDMIGKIPTCYYGTICTALTAYALEIPNVDSGYVVNIPGMVKQFDLVSEDGTRHSLNDLELVDILIIEGHGAIVTDIARNKSGDVEWVEVSEATRQGSTNSSVLGGQYGGLCRRIMMTVDEFFTWFDGFAVYRYSYLDRIPYKPNPYVPMVDEGNRNPTLDFPVMPYEGNKSVYQTTSVIPYVNLIINHDGFTHLRVKKDGENYNQNNTGDLYELPTDGSKEITIKCKKAEGRYTAYLCNSAETSKTVSCMWYCRPAPVPDVSVTDGKLTAVVNMERDEYKPFYYAFESEVTQSGNFYLLNDDNMTTEKNENGFVYTITAELPDGATEFCIGFSSDEFGIMKKTTQLSS